MIKTCSDLSQIDFPKNFYDEYNLLPQTTRSRNI